MYRGKRIGVVVPAYNEEPHILKVLEGMPDFVDTVYVVDDACTDRTADIVREWTSSGVGAGSHACPQNNVMAASVSSSAVGAGSHACPQVELLQHPANRG
ncbi:MAG: glycosyltransferase, partial [Dehalococcoidia bacterium]|nr:glycosyltransferase [Dehalococcoidia bacterium]